ncbi:MAG: bifunctional ADP-heptose synthase [Bacteroidia bacterium]
MNRQELQRIFEHFRSLKIVIIGDVMVDSYVFGRVDRISPEAPVPVVKVTGKENRLGGAANVARNIRALGATPILVGAIGNDRDGDNFVNLMTQEGMSVAGLIRTERHTTVKTRIIGNKHQLLRVDEEDEYPAKAEEEQKIIAHVNKIIDGETPDAIIFEDYDKGFIFRNLIEQVVEISRSKNIVTAADPKARNFHFFRKVDLFKPNLKEIREGLAIHVNPADNESVIQADKKLREILNHRLSLITLSDHGLALCSNDELIRVPAEEIHIADVSGAGDTVISTATLCLVSGIDMQSLAQIANLAGAEVCEKVGVVPVNASELLDKALIALTDSVNNE